MDFNFDIDGNGYIKKRESHSLEYKQNFQQGDNLLKYTKTIAGMANNKGGQMIFGIQDKPHVPIGMTNQRFIEIDPKVIDTTLRDYFSPEIQWQMHVLEYDGKKFGQIVIEESLIKPVLCKKNRNDILREGAIYYRYRAETKEIEYPELRKLLDAEQEKEKKLWMEHIQKISLIGPRNVQFLDTFKGELNIGNEKVLMDKALLDKVKFIKEGHFVDNDGAPALILKGEITGIIDAGQILPSNKAYPYNTSDICKTLNWNPYQFKCVLWQEKIKGDGRYHDEVRIGQKSVTHKYSDSLAEHLKDLVEKSPDLVQSACKKFSMAQKQNKLVAIGEKAHTKGN
ncbi:MULTISPECIES: helix-turn-helix domain-containing protein [unclassified Pedobacter]|uniref:AlbA family DNA-binding domain-containing protein n=1 Tax=unclassified Pedobacter TaxID=2628915 RepID=UPI001D9B1CC6|nr:MULTISPECIES: ATP-binding protein [unclassified Pedobacter]CAH0186054.1 hypothetical protein SRABI36_01630 [Pedobacter sp. Bi36]CAH0241840.1 hypothetical protein SRABI126_02723 [Pedobacter sp. Bi126]